MEKLESGDLSLEESLQAFEEGVNLSLFCQQELKNADGKVNLLIKKMNGELELVDFD